jgi:hypothetical protein
MWERYCGKIYKTLFLLLVAIGAFLFWWSGRLLTDPSHPDPATEHVIPWPIRFSGTVFVTPDEYKPISWALTAGLAICALMVAIYVIDGFLGRM